MRSLVFCTTCKFSGRDKFGPDGKSGGEKLIKEVEQLLRENGRDDVRIARQSCLWACKRHCNVWFRDTEKYSYLAGDFVPGREAAEAIVGWFDLHGASEDGWVSFKQWPDGMRGHFIARMPPDVARFEEDA